MSELELLCETAPAPAPASPRARARARAALFARVDTSRHRRRRVWFFSASGAVATLAVAVAVFFALGTGGGQNDASAANLLHRAAKAALAQPGFDALRPDQYIYTKSVDAYLSTSVLENNRSYSILIPHTRESWLNADGTGWLYETSGVPSFLSDRDRQLWIKAGRPALGSSAVTDMELRNEDGPNVPMASLDLPSDPDVLFAQFKKQALGHSRGTYVEMFTLIGDSLRESYTTPAQRAALFEVTARLPGVELVDNVTDAVGRTGTGVAIVDKVNHTRETLIFDPTNYGLMGEQESVLSGNGGYPTGTVIGHGAYLEQAVVDALKKRP